MKLYMYKTQTNEMVCELEATHITADGAVDMDGYTHMVGNDHDYSSKADLSEALCAREREKNLSTEQKIAQIEEILADMLFGGVAVE